MEANKVLKEAIRKLEYSVGEYLSDEELAVAIKHYQALSDSLGVMGDHYTHTFCCVNDLLNTMCNWQYARCYSIKERVS